MTTSCLLGRCSKGLTGGLQFVIFFSIPVLQLFSPAFGRAGKGWERLGKAGKGWERQPHLPCRSVSRVSLLKQLDLLREPKFLHFFFWQLLTTIRDLFIYGLIIITLLMVFSKWGKHHQEIATPISWKQQSLHPGKFLQLPEALRG